METRDNLVGFPDWQNVQVEFPPEVLVKILSNIVKRKNLTAPLW